KTPAEPRTTARRKPRAAVPARRRAPRYADDGLSGLILRLPWWLHLLMAVLMWPLFTEALPRLPVHEAWQLTLLREWAPRGWPLLSAGCVLMALVGARRAAGRRGAKPVSRGRRRG
ncbi:MAG TPA: hypothetical protein PKW88_09270, partial [Plasticicumulans sp.]|nr:hypothetical protein [Plasticicumulans sp.]